MLVTIMIVAHVQYARDTSIFLGDPDHISSRVLRLYALGRGRPDCEPSEEEEARARRRW